MKKGFKDIYKVLVPIANGTEEIEVVTIIDTLIRAGSNVTIASIENNLQVLFLFLSFFYSFCLLFLFLNRYY